jgi:hypothetical protein
LLSAPITQPVNVFMERAKVFLVASSQEFTKQAVSFTPKLRLRALV